MPGLGEGDKLVVKYLGKSFQVTGCQRVQTFEGTLTGVGGKPALEQLNQSGVTLHISAKLRVGTVGDAGEMVGLADAYLFQP